MYLYSKNGRPLQVSDHTVYCKNSEKIIDLSVHKFKSFQTCSNLSFNIFHSLK